MRTVVLDTNVLLRLANPATTSIDAFAGQFRFLVETRDAFERWRTLVTEQRLKESGAYDARNAAVMLPKEETASERNQG